MSASGSRVRPLSPVIKVVLSLAFIAVVFIAAGTFRWTAFWVLLGFYVATTGGWMLWLKRRDPGLLKERMTGGTRPDVKRWDKAIIRAYTLQAELPGYADYARAVRWKLVPGIW